MEHAFSFKSRVFLLLENRSNRTEDIWTAVSKQRMYKAKVPRLRQLKQSGSQKVHHCYCWAPGFRFLPKQLLVWGSCDSLCPYTVLLSGEKIKCTPSHHGLRPRNCAGIVIPSLYYISVCLLRILVVSHLDIHGHLCFSRKNFLLCRIMNGGRSFFKSEHKEKTRNISSMK